MPTSPLRLGTVDIVFNCTRSLTVIHAVCLMGSCAEAKAQIQPGSRQDGLDPGKGEFEGHTEYQEEMEYTANEGTFDGAELPEDEDEEEEEEEEYEDVAVDQILYKRVIGAQQSPITIITDMMLIVIEK